jgi:hypothetical protein
MSINLSRIPQSNSREIEIKIDEFDKGVNKLVEEVRVKQNEAVEALNLMLEQDGVWRPRWGSAYYTPAISGVTDVDGFHEYVKPDGTTELIIAGDDGKIYKSIDGAAPTELTTSGGASAGWTGGNVAYFLQINNYLYITNGVDDLLRYDGTNLEKFAQISAPTWAGTPLTRGAGLSAGSYTYYYQVTALNDIGETVGSTEQSITVDVDRDSWIVASDQYIDLDWDAVTGARRYQVYLSDESGYEVLLGSTTVTEFRDDGTLTTNPYIDVPDDNTTGSPKFRQMAVSNNRMWATYDTDNKYRAHFSGTGKEMGTFSDFYGGGWIDLEKGGRETPKAVVHYQDGQGTGKATVLCSTPEGQGGVWQISLQSLTVEEDTFVVPSASKIVGSVGTDAPLGVVLAENDIWFPNKRGVFTLGPEKNYYGILRTNELSSRIRPYWRNLNGSALDRVSAYYYDAKIFFSVATTGSENNRTIVYDRERRAWYVDWSIGAKQWGEYTDSSGNTHFLFSEDGSSRLVELSASFKGDKGSAFQTSYISPRIPMGKHWTDFAKIRKAYIRLGNPVGAINFSVLGTEKKKGYSGLASETITAQFSLTGMGWDQMGTVQMGDSAGTPTAFAQASDIRYLKVNKKVRELQFKVTSDSIETDYTILGLYAKGFLIQTSPPGDWKLS